MMSAGYHNADLQVLNSEFLDALAVAAPRTAWLWTNAFIGNPDGHPGWHGRPYDGSLQARTIVDGYGRQNAYFSTAALNEIEGIVKRKKTHFARLLALVVDDPKAVELLAPPSWILNTSPGKNQVGFLLDEQDPDCANLKLVDTLVTRMVTMGLIGGDKSGNNAVRYVRLPNGENQKPRETGHFQVRLLQWAPNKRYTLEDAAGALQIDLDDIRKIAASPEAQSTGPIHGEQDDKLRQATQNIIAGTDLHDSTNIIAASLIASGAHPGAAVNMLRGLMDSSQAPRNERWQARYNDIPRAVETAHQKFRQPWSMTTIDPATGAEVREPLFRKAGSLLANLKPIEFVVDGYLERDAIASVFGPAGCGKSFITLDMGACVATGTAWHGMKVRQGPVFAIIGEGVNGYGRRLKAWSQHYEVSLEDAPLYVSRHAVSLSNPQAGIELAAEIDQMCSDTSEAPSLIIIDTVARNFGDGDENSTQDMSRFVANIDMYLKHRYRANILLVHHSGHDGERARGSSALKAALDQEFKVSGVIGHPKLECTKMKDAEMPLERSFKITSVTLGQDADGIEITGAVVVPDGNPIEFQVGSRVNGQAVTAGDIVKQFVDHVKGYEAMAVSLNCGQKAARTAIQKVVQAGLLEKAGRWFTLSPDGVRQALAACWITTDWKP